MPVLASTYSRKDMFTRKHFIAAAKIIAALDDADARANATYTAVRHFSILNRRFDADRFRAFVDCERSCIMAYRVVVMARASKAA